VTRPLRAIALGASLALAAPITAAQAQAPPILLDARPYVPRYQGPYEPSGASSGQTALGLSLLGAGALSGGLGLLWLEGDQDQPRGVQVGATLLVTGVFLGGLGFYTLAPSAAPRTVLSQQDRDDQGWRFALTPTPDGAFLSSATTF
jgi:hypothetical protein